MIRAHRKFLVHRLTVNRMEVIDMLHSFYTIMSTSHVWPPLGCVA